MSGILVHSGRPLPAGKRRIGSNHVDARRGLKVRF